MTISKKSTLLSCGAIAVALVFFMMFYVGDPAAVAFVSGGLTAVAVLLYMFFIKPGAPQPQQELSEEISAQLLGDYENLSSRISEAVAAIDKIMQDKERGERKMSALAEKSGVGIEKNKKTAYSVNGLNSQIAGITHVIGEIKTTIEQTRLLSLNASIEAASAGEYGKGFALVAGAVKSLADQSADSALKIEHAVASIGRGSAESVEAATEVMKISEEQNTCVEEMRLIFSSIAPEIEAVNSVLGNIKSLSDKTASTIEELKGTLRLEVKL